MNCFPAPLLRNSARLLALPLSVCLMASAVAAETLWNEFRGPTQQGISTAKNLPVEWSREKNLRWRVEVPGRAWSSPVVANGRIFLTNARLIKEDAPEAGITLRVQALRADNGQTLWDTEVFQQLDPAALRMHDKNSHASPSPIYEAGRIYAHFGHHGTACVDEAGKVVWTNREQRYNPVHGTGGSPVLVDNLLIFNVDGAADPAVVALDKKTGVRKWRVTRPPSGAPNKFSFATPLVIEAAGKKQLITPGSGVVQSLDPATGNEIWRVLYGNGFSVVPRPVFAHGMVFLSSGYQQPVGYAIKVDGQGDVTNTHVAWTSRKRVPLNPSMLVLGDELYQLSDTGILSCLNARTGDTLYEERVLSNCSASLLAANGRIYALDERGKTVVVKAGPVFQLLATNDLMEPTLASFSVCNEDLLIRTEKALYRIGGQ